MNDERSGSEGRQHCPGDIHFRVTLRSCLRVFFNRPMAIIAVPVLIVPYFAQDSPHAWVRLANVGKIALGAAALMFVVAVGIRILARRQRIVVSPSKEAVTFSYFAVGPSVWTARVQPTLTVPFALMATSHLPGDLVGGITVRCPEGSLTVKAFMGNYGDLKELLEQVNRGGT